MRVEPVQQPNPVVFTGHPPIKNKVQTIYYPKPDGQDVVILNGKGYPL